MKRDYDSRKHAKEPSLAVGMKVWLNNAQIRPHSSNVLTHRSYNGPWFISEIITSPTNEQGPSYRIVHAETGKAHRAPVPAFRLKVCHDREALVKRFSPENAPPISMQDADTQSTAAAASVTSADKPAAAHDLQHDVTTASPMHNALPVSVGYEPAICIQRQRGRGTDATFLVLFKNKEKYWCKFADVSQELLRHWRLKQERSRRNKRRKLSKD
jgi:hypothetical protein